MEKSFISNGVSIILLAIITISFFDIGFNEGKRVGYKNAQNDASFVGAGKYIANPTNGEVSFYWNTNN